MTTQLPSSYLGHALEAALAATLLILLVLAIRKPVARHFGAGIAYALWLLPLARLVLPPLPNQVSVFGWLKAAPEAAASAPAYVSPDWAKPAAARLAESGAASPAGHVAEAAALPAALTEPSGFALPQMGDLIALAGGIGLAVWAAGALWFAGRSLVSHARFMAVLDREAEPVTGELAALSLEVAREAGLKRMPRIVTSLISSGPFVTGLVRPAVVLPAWFAEDYSRTEARAAIAHELTHVKRGDLWALQVAEIFVALMWFNPLAYIARRAFRTDQEAACDADVLRRGHASPHAYGATLVKAVRMQMPSRMALTTSLPLTHALKERLKLMTYPAPDTRRRWMGFGTAVLLGTAALAGTASVAAAGEQKERREVKIENGTLWLDGEKVEGRQAVLLSDPVKGLVPLAPMAPEVRELSMRISKDASELMTPEMLGALTDFTGSEDFKEITRISVELGAMGAALGAEAALESLSMSFSGMTEEEIEAWAEDFEARMEAKAAAIEARAAEMEIAMEARAELLDARLDKETEARILAIEKRIEGDAARLEAAVERQFGDEFEAKIKARTGIIPELVEACASAELAGGETRVLERRLDNGESVKLACVDGGPGVLKEAATIRFIETHPGLSDEERARFLEHKADGKRAFIMSRDAKVHRVKAPKAPKEPKAAKDPTVAPEAPEAPEPPEAIAPPR